MEFDGFDWDRGNREKCQKHGMPIAEIESLFQGPVVILRRYRAVGTTAGGRERGNAVRLRPISARYMHKKEVAVYEKAYPDV